MPKARLGAVVLIAFAHCGGTPPVQTPTPVLPVPTSSATAPTSAFDLSPVAAPSSLLLVARFMRPAKIPGVIATWTGLPIPIDEALSEAFGDRVAATIDTAQPIDIAVMLETRRGGYSRPVFVASAGVRSIDDAKNGLSSSFNFAPLSNGAFRLQPQKRNVRCEEDDDECQEMSHITRQCILSPAYGTATARIVCGRSGVDPVYPYLVRGVTRIDAPSDIHAEIFADGVRGMLGDRSFARDITRLASLGTDLLDLSGDVDKLVIDAKAEDAAASANAVLAFKRTASSFTRALLAHGDKAGPPPATFTKLPADSDAAFYESGIELKELDHAKQVAADLLDKDLMEDSVPAADRKAMTDGLRSLISLMEAPMVFAKGTDLAAAQSAIGAAKSTKAGAAQQAAEKLAIAKLGGWTIIGVELPLSKVGPVAKEWVAIVARTAIAKWGQSRTDAPPPTFKIAPLAKGLPADAQHYELTLPIQDWTPPPPPSSAPTGKPGAPPKPTVIMNKVQLYFVPEGTGRTWIVSSIDDTTAVDRAKALLAGSGTTLGSRAGLDELKAARSNAGGFITMRGIALDNPLTIAGYPPARYLERPDPLFGMATSNLGVNPVSFWIASGTKQTLTAGAKVSREAIRDGMVLSRALHW